MTRQQIVEAAIVALQKCGIDEVCLDKMPQSFSFTPAEAKKLIETLIDDTMYWKGCWV